MLTDEQLKNLPPKAREYWRKAFDFVAQKGADWVLVTLDSERGKAWERYFELNDWTPWMIKQARSNWLKEFSVPAEWPEWFDSKYAIRVVEHPND